MVNRTSQFWLTKEEELECVLLQTASLEYLLSTQRRCRKYITNELEKITH